MGITWKKKCKRDQLGLIGCNLRWMCKWTSITLNNKMLIWPFGISLSREKVEVSDVFTKLLVELRCNIAEVKLRFRWNTGGPGGTCLINVRSQFRKAKIQNRNLTLGLLCSLSFVMEHMNNKQKQMKIQVQRSWVGQSTRCTSHSWGTLGLSTPGEAECYRWKWTRSDRHSGCRGEMSEPPK